MCAFTQSIVATVHHLNQTLLIVYSVAESTNKEQTSVTAVRWRKCHTLCKRMKLLKHYKTGKGTKARQFVNCLSNMAVVGDDQSYYAYTKEWISKANRGGLFESCFLFFRSVELQT